MIRVAGVDGAPNGWAVVSLGPDGATVQRVARLADLFASGAAFDIVAVDTPMGLADAYETGGRLCDRLARARLRTRGSSVFPAPVRAVLAAATYDEARAASRASSPLGKALTIQAWNIVPKIREADALLRERPELRDVLREVHPELSFAAMAGAPLAVGKKTPEGRAARRGLLAPVFGDIEALVAAGRAQGLPAEDVLDAAAISWSARRIAEGCSESLPDPPETDALGLRMAIWI